MYSEHKALLKRTSTQGVVKRHKEQFVGWFEHKVSNVLIFMTKQHCNCALFKMDQFFFLLHAGKGTF
jgi:hypothetical protein